MYARDLMFWLHERLAEPGTLEQTQKRFEALRGYGLLPRGRENAGVRLSDDQIASAVLGFAHPLPGFAGHASLVLGDLRPIGGGKASFKSKTTLLSAIAHMFDINGASSDLQRLTVSIERDFNEDEYTARIYFREHDQTNIVSFTSKYDEHLLESGAEENYNHERLMKLSATQRSFGSTFFRDLSQAISISRHLDRPFKTDWREYETEEEIAEFHKRLGARPSSHFLNLRVDAQVTWPKEPTRIEFGGHNLALFPKTKERSDSISIDLTRENISADNARSLMNRMLSVMSWCDNQPASLHEGWSGSPIPAPMPKKNPGSMTAHEWHFYRTPPSDEQLKRCLAFYRDGLNAFSVGLGSHAVLSFYRVIETKFGKDKPAIIRWIDAAFEANHLSTQDSAQTYELDRQSTGLGHGKYIYKWCRVATAHAAQDAPSDPDGAEEARRLLNAAKVIRQLARHFIKQEFNYSDSYLTDDSK
jgi:hypothetical protein